MSAARQHADPEVLAGVEQVHGCSDATGDGAVDGVLGLRPVDRDDQDAVALLGEDGVLGSLP